MANMDYCKFENTNGDLSDCMENIEDFDLSESENEARINLIKKCIEIAEDFKFHANEEQSVEDYFKDNSEVLE